MVREAILGFLTIWTPYLIPAVTFLLFAIFEFFPSKWRNTTLVALGALALLPFDFLAQLFGLSGEFIVLFSAIYGAFAFIVFALIFFNLVKLLPRTLERPFFVLVAVVMLPPFIIPAGFVPITLNFGIVLFMSLFSGSIISIPRWFMNPWWFHLLSFFTIAILGYFVGKKFLSNKPLQPTGYAGG